MATVADAVESEDEDEEHGDDESRVSASEYGGDLAALPDRMLFGEEECRAIFGLSSDKEAFLRVCGCNLAACKREGHRASRLTNRAKPGSYVTTRSRKFVDGKLETWVPLEEYEANQQLRKQEQAHELVEAAALLNKARSPTGSNADYSPSGSEEEAYSFAAGKAGVGGRNVNLAHDAFSPERWDRKKSSDEMPALLEREAGSQEDLKSEQDTWKQEGKVVSPVEKTGDPTTQEMDSKIMMKAMMGLMSGVNNSLQAVAGGMKEMQDERRILKQEGEGGVHSKEKARKEWNSETGDELKYPMGMSKSPRHWVKEARDSHCEWYAVAKGRDGASGVFESYEEAKDLVYRVSGAIWKKFKTYDDAWMYIQHFEESGANSESNWYYGVANGKGNYSGVFEEYPAAQAMVERVSGASWKKFRSKEEASKFVQLHRRDLRARSPERESRRSSHFGEPGEEEGFDSLKGGSIPRVQAPFQAAPDPRSKEKNLGINPMGYGVGGQFFEGYRPPLELAGEDPSTKKDEEIWGMDIGAGEVSIREKLCPPDLPVGLQKGLVDAMIDAVAQPGGSMGGADSEVNNNDVWGQALEELVYQGRGGGDEAGSRKTDLNWRARKRTSLREVDSLELLRKRIKTLIKLRERIPKRVMKACKNAFIRAGWTDPHRIEAWAQGGYFLRLARDSMDFYLSLHQHLMGLATADNVPWSYVQIELDHHVEELDLLRSSQDSRIQAILALYAYLRDGVASNWHSSSLQYKRNLDAMAMFGGREGGESSMTCGKCGTALHGGGRGVCPWRNLSDQSAKKKGEKVLINWSTGIGSQDLGANS